MAFWRVAIERAFRLRVEGRSIREVESSGSS